MGLFKRKNKAVDPNAPLASLSDRDRAELISTLEGERADVVFRIEECMREAAQKGKMRSLARRRYPLGKSPNDYN